MLSNKILAACCRTAVLLRSTTSVTSMSFSKFSSKLVIVNTVGVLGLGATGSYPLKLPQSQIRNVSITAQDYAARKSTREKKEKLKKKRKKEPEVKKTFVQKMMDKKAKIAYVLQRPPDNSHLPEPLDNVYFYQRFRDKIWTFAEAIENHRDFLHPTMRNYPSSLVMCRIDIDFVYPNRPNKMMETWKSLVEMKSPFISAGTVMPKILAFCLNDNDAITEVIQAGAETAGSNELIKSIQEGHLSIGDYDHVIAHPLMVIELTAIRGLLKRKFPSTKAGTVDVDLVPVVRKLKSGIKVEVQRTDREPDFAWIECPIGKLDMAIEELESNFMQVLKDTLPRRVTGKSPRNFIVQCSLKTSNSLEKFILDKDYYIALCDSKADGAASGNLKDKTQKSKSPSLAQGREVEKSSSAASVAS